MNAAAVQRFVLEALYAARDNDDPQLAGLVSVVAFGDLLEVTFGQTRILVTVRPATPGFYPAAVQP